MKYIIFLSLGIAVLFVLSSTVSAETESDPQGDVWHFVYPYWNQQTIDDKPNIDIKEIKAEFNGDQITLSIVLWPGGTFSRGQNEHAAYVMSFNTSDAYYMMSYSDIAGETAAGGAFGMSLEGTSLPSSGEVTVNDNILSATLEKVGEDTSKMEFWGTAWIYEEYGAEQYLNDAWFDWVGDYDWAPEFAPDEDDDQEEKDPGDDETDGEEDEGDGGNGEDSTNGGSSPGFELILLLAAFAIIIIVYRKKK